MARFLWTAEEMAQLDHQQEEKDGLEAAQCLRSLLHTSDRRLYAWSPSQGLPLHHPLASPFDSDKLLSSIDESDTTVAVRRPVPASATSLTKTTEKLPAAGSKRKLIEPVASSPRPLGPGGFQASSPRAVVTAQRAAILGLLLPQEPLPLRPQDVPGRIRKEVGHLSALLWHITSVDSIADFNERFVRYCGHLCQLFLARMISSESFLPIANPHPTTTTTTTGSTITLTRRQKWQLRAQLLPALLGWPVREIRLGSRDTQAGADITVDVHILPLPNYLSPTTPITEFIHRLTFRGPGFFSERCLPQSLWTAMVETTPLTINKDDVYLSLDQVPAPVTPWSLGVQDFDRMWHVPAVKKRLAEGYARTSALLLRLLSAGLRVSCHLLDAADLRHHVDFHTKVANFFAANAAHKVFESQSKRTEAVQNLFMHTLDGTLVPFLPGDLQYHDASFTLDPSIDPEHIAKISRELFSVLRQFRFPQIEQYSEVILPEISVVGPAEHKKIRISLQHPSSPAKDFALELPLKESVLHSYLNVRGNLSRIIELLVRVYFYYLPAGGGGSGAASSSASAGVSGSSSGGGGKKKKKAVPALQ